jgi:hypothetical protein
VRAVGQKNLHSHGRAIAAESIANAFVEFLECHAGVFLAGQQQQRADVFLAAAFGAFDRVFGDSPNVRPPLWGI